MFKEAAGIYQIAISFDVQAACVNSFKKTVSKQKLQGVKGAFHFFKSVRDFFKTKRFLRISDRFLIKT